MCFLWAEEITDHLFVQYSYIHCIWQWIDQYYIFTFLGIDLHDIWTLDASIPFKNIQLVEIIRAAIMWVFWLERNIIYFKGGNPKIIKIMGLHVISLVSFWCKTVNESLFLNLPLLLPQDVQNLHMHVGNLGIGMVQEEMESIPDLMFGIENEVVYLMDCWPLSFW
jgi:hypothetical protein